MRSKDGQDLGRYGMPLALTMHPSNSDLGVAFMLDVIFVAVTIGFFALGIAYVRACQGL
jgi:hypothetical protein